MVSRQLSQMIGLPSWSSKMDEFGRATRYHNAFQAISVAKVAFVYWTTFAGVSLIFFLLAITRYNSGPDDAVALAEIETQNWMVYGAMVFAFTFGYLLVHTTIKSRDSAKKDSLHRKVTNLIETESQRLQDAYRDLLVMTVQRKWDDLHCFHKNADLHWLYSSRGFLIARIRSDECTIAMRSDIRASELEVRQQSGVDGLASFRVLHAANQAANTGSAVAIQVAAIASGVQSITSQLSMSRYVVNVYLHSSSNPIVVFDFDNDEGSAKTFHALLRMDLPPPRSVPQLNQVRPSAPKSLTSPPDGEL